MIICRSKNKTVVEYALRTASKPIGVATYTAVPQLPETYREELPSPEDIAERLRLWDDDLSELTSRTVIINSEEVQL